MIQAREERAQMLRDAKELKDKIVNEAKDQAKAEANKIVSEANAQIQQQKMAALTDVKNEIGKLSVEVAEKILRKQLAAGEAQDQYVNMLAEEIKLN
jgi:F-type H+-transporting ATPase subunit b